MDVPFLCCHNLVAKALRGEPTCFQPSRLPLRQFAPSNRLFSQLNQDVARDACSGGREDFTSGGVGPPGALQPFSGKRAKSATIATRKGGHENDTRRASR